MTCIVGIAHEAGVTIGGDSAGTAGHSLSVRADSKVFQTSGYVMGFTTSFRMGQILRYSSLPAAPAPQIEWDLDRFMATTFVNAVRDVLDKGGWLGKDRDQRDDGGTFLVGARGALYAIYDDFQIGRTLNGYAAVGSGQDLALGSLHTTDGLGWAPERRATAALTAAADHNSTVSAPFVLADVAP